MNTLTDPGEKRRTVTVETKSGNAVTLTLSVSVRAAWRLYPHVVDFGQINLGVEKERFDRQVRVESDTDTVLSASSDVPWLEAHLADDVKGTRILLRLVPDKLPPGENSAAVSVITTNEVKREGVVYVRVTGYYELHAATEHVFLVDAETANISFVDRAGRNAPVTRATSADKRVSVEVRRDGTIALSRNTEARQSESIVINVFDQSGRSGRLLVTLY